MKTITAAWLREKEACKEQVKVFEREWPKGCSISRKNLLRAATLELDLVWFAKQYLTAPVYAAYQKAMAPVYAAYQKAMAPVEAAYQKAMASAEAAYQEVKAPIYAAYQKAMAPAEAAHQEAMAIALWEAIKGMY